MNYTVNYLDRAGVEAVIDYWDTVVLTPRLRELIMSSPRVQLYMDSLELSTFGAGGLLWGPAVIDEFHDRRGYDDRRFLPLLTRTNGMMAVQTRYHNEPDEQHRVLAEKVRFDCVRTLTDLYIENMLRPRGLFEK